MPLGRLALVNSGDLTEAGRPLVALATVDHVYKRERSE